MDREKLEHIINVISKGDTVALEILFNKPAGRKHFETIVLIIVFNLPYRQEEQEELFIAFREALDKIEKRIQRQKEGQQILDQV